MPEKSNTAWRKIIADRISIEAQPIDKFSHQPRLYATARLVSTDLDFDDDVLYAAAWLHDLGVFIGHRPEDPVALSAWDNVAYAMEQTPAVLEQAGFPQEKIPGVIEAIRTHQPSFGPTTLEGIILRDADILEQLGAIGILRAVCKIGRDTRFPRFDPVIKVLQNAVDTLPGLLKLESAKALAVPKVEVLRHFLSSAVSESLLLPM